MNTNAFLLTFLALVCLAAFSAGDCSLSPAQLTSQRLAALELWTERVNQDVNYYSTVANQLMTEDHSSRIVQIGTFEPKNVALEYGLLLFVATSGTAPGVRLRQVFDPTTVVWDSVDQSHHTFTQNISSVWDPVNNVYTTHLDGVRQPETIIWEPCSARIQRSYVVNDPLAQQVYDASPVTTDPVTLCFLIMLACPAGTPFQQYTDIGDCIGFLSQVPAKSVCPHKFASNTTTCRLLHVSAAFVDPTVHCPHVARDSMPCRDSCLPSCDGCNVNAECQAFPSLTNAGDPDFQCRCKNGFTGNGKTTCAADACSAQYQCPGDYNEVKCTSGLCGCTNTFSWNSTQAAYNNHAACECASNEVVSWATGVAECLPKGRCYQQWQCPQSFNQVKCVPYGTNPFRSYGNCLCNYGFDNPGFEQQCSCPATKRVLWSSAVNGEVCLSSSECTESWHCASNSCVVSAGSPIGHCN